MYRWIPLMLLTVVLAAATGFYVRWITQSPVAVEALTVLPEAKIISDFTLSDHRGEPFNLQRLQGQWSLLFFGFTSCPDVCPNTLYELQRANAMLSAQHEGEGAAVQVVLVSVDPERDTPEKLAAYVTYFDPSFLGVTGRAEQLTALASELGIHFQVEPHEEGAERYDVIHSSAVVLMNPEGRMHGAFTPPLLAEPMARDLQLIAAD
jgi:protein SCO1/2